MAENRVLVLQNALLEVVDCDVSEVVEHSMSIPSIDAVLTILWVPIADLED